MVHVAPDNRKKKDAYGTATGVQALQVPASFTPPPLAPAPAAPTPSTLLLHEAQDFDHKSLGAVGGKPEGGPWSPDPFAPGRELNIFTPDCWAAVRKQAAAEGDANLLHAFPVIYQPY